MTTSTPNLGLVLYNSTTDQAEYFSNFRATIAGTSLSSNFYKIDTAYGSMQTEIDDIQIGAYLTLASYISANYYEATVTGISSYTTGMKIILSLDTVSAGTVTLNINSLGIKSVMKIDSSGTPVNITGAELMVDKYYFFAYDGTRWIWVDANSADQIYIAGTSGNVVTVNSDNTLLGTTTQSLLLSQTIYNATAKTTLADADRVGITDSASSNVLKHITWANFVTAIGTKLGSIITALTAKTTPVDADEIAIGDSASSFASKKLSFTNLKAFFKTYIDTLYPSKDGWSPVSDSWSYASASTITVPSDATLTYQKGVKIRFKQGAGYKYYVANTVASTLITALVNTDYTVANAAITDISYSYAENPLGFPSSFNYTSTVSGSTGSAGTYTETVQVSRYIASGKNMFVSVHKKITNKGSWSGGIRFLLPVGFSITAASPTYLLSASIVATSSITPKGLGTIYSGSTVLEFESSLGAAILDWSAIATNDWITVEISYPY